MQKIALGLMLPLLLFALEKPGFAQTDSQPHIIINEIQIAGASNNDEFIELFNPADTPFNLEGYKLTKKTKTGGSEIVLVSTAKFSGTIQARGYFLIAHPDYQNQISADLSYSSSTYYLSKDNSVFLYDKNGQLLDKVGFGAVDSSNSESNPAPNPEANQSIERVSFIDTNNNAADFSLNNSPSPKNSTVVENYSEESLDSNGSLENTENNGSGIELDTQNSCPTASSDVKLSEIFPYPASGNEFVEIRNNGENCVDVSGWKIMDEAGHKKEFPQNSIIAPGEYLFLEGNLYLNNDLDTVYLLDANANTKTKALDQRSYEKAQKDFSFALENQDWQWTSSPTPGGKNIITAPETAEKNITEKNISSEATENYPSDANIYLNEILPNPTSESDEEYIEMANGGSKAVDLFGWRLKDASKNKGYQFKEHILLKPREYLVIYKSQSKISLNNSRESLFLYNLQGNIVSDVSYEKSEKNVSYNFDGKTWRWSKYLTPGKENKFDTEPSVKIKKIKRAYKGVPTKFSARAKDKETKKLKYLWDFGDGKKSSLKKTTHKYLDTGKYTVKLFVSDESQTIEKSFSVNVKKSPQPDIEIVKIVPNPPGNDLENESIDLKNNSEKKVNLVGWKIATGSGDKLFNHPISDETILEPGETKTITRKISKFTLNNKSGKVQLVSLDGKIVDEVAYEKDSPDSLHLPELQSLQTGDKSKRAGEIAEGEVYAKMDGKWQWIVPPTESLPQEKPQPQADQLPAENKQSNEKNISEKEISDQESISSENENEKEKVLGAMDEKQPFSEPVPENHSAENKSFFIKILSPLKRGYGKFISFLRSFLRLSPLA
jgi:hypothetical protein